MSFSYFYNNTLKSFLSVFESSVNCWIALFNTNKAHPMLFDTFESIMSIASLTPSIIFLCSYDICFKIYGFISYFVLFITPVVLFFLKFLVYSYSLWLYTFTDPLVFGKYLVLILPVVFYSEILASFKLDILGAFFVYSMNP